MYCAGYAVRARDNFFVYVVFDYRFFIEGVWPGVCIIFILCVVVVCEIVIVQRLNFSLM